MSQGTRIDKLVLTTLSYPGKQLCETHTKCQDINWPAQEHEWIIAPKPQMLFPRSQAGWKKKYKINKDLPLFKENCPSVSQSSSPLRQKKRRLKKCTKILKCLLKKKKKSRHWHNAVYVILFPQCTAIIATVFLIKQNTHSDVLENPNALRKVFSTLNICF